MPALVRLSHEISHELGEPPDADQLVVPSVWPEPFGGYGGGSAIADVKVFLRRDSHTDAVH
jgi:hypothetical protein